MSVAAALDVIDYDNRSDNQKLVLTLSNAGQGPIVVWQTHLSVAGQAQVIEAADDSSSSLGGRFQELTRDLSSIINRKIEQLRPKDRWSSLFRSLGSVRIHLPFFSSVEFKTSEAKPSVDLQNASDAEAAQEQWLTDGADKVDTAIYAFKLMQLRNLEEQLSTISTQSAATIAGGGSVRIPYVVYFKRNPFATKRFLVTARVDILNDADELQRLSVSNDVSISGSTWGLSTAAMTFACCGAVVRCYSITPLDLRLSNSWLTGVLPSALLSLFVFNVYERLNLKFKAPLPPNWRTALFLGFIIGFFQGRIISSLEALVGLGSTLKT